MHDFINFVVALAAVLAVGAAYFGPWIIASRRQHRSVAAIAVLNFCFGWTVLGWFGALIWSLTGNVWPKQAQS